MEQVKELANNCFTAVNPMMVQIPQGDKKEKCKVCGCRIRGEFHQDGMHHKRDSKVCSKKAARAAAAANARGKKTNVGDPFYK